MKWTIAAAALSVSAHARAAPPEEFYVRPPPRGDDAASGRTPGEAVASLSAARDRVRASRAGRGPDSVPVIVHVGGGVYELADTFTLGPEDSGEADAPVTYRAADLGDAGKDRAVISGGSVVSGWERASPGTWSASVALEPPPEQNPRDLYRAEPGRYDQGQRLIRARYPNVNPRHPYDPAQWMRVREQERVGGMWRITAVGFPRAPCPDPPRAPYCATASPPPQDGADLDDGVEIVARRKFVAPRQALWVRPPYEWGAGMLGEPVFWAPRRLGTEAPNIAVGPHDEFHVEGAAEWIDEDDEWAMSADGPPGTGRLQLRSRSDPGRATMIVPRLTTLVRLDRVRFVSFDGLTFCYTNRPRLAGGYNPEFCGHAAPTPAIPGVEKNDQLLAGAVELDGTQGCALVRCTVAHTGGIGVVVQSRRHGPGEGEWTFARDNVLRQCAVLDCGGTGVHVGSLKNPYPSLVPNAYPDLASHWVLSTSVTDCRILGYGSAYRDAAGIYIRKSVDTLISHNEVGPLPGSADGSACWYSGIVSASFGPGPEPHNARVVIEYNHVHHVVSRLSDGGGIYVEGHQPESAIRGNWVHAMPRDPRNNTDCLTNSGLYFDRGARGFAVEGNLLERIGNYTYEPELCCGDAECARAPRVATLQFNTEAGAWPESQSWPAGNPNYVDREFDRLVPGGAVPPGAVVVFSQENVPEAVVRLRAAAGPR